MVKKFFISRGEMVIFDLDSHRGEIHISFHYDTVEISP